MAAPAPQGSIALLLTGPPGMAQVSVLAMGARRKPPVRSALADVLGSPGRVGVFFGVSCVVTFCYTLLLPFEYTQRLGFANWGYLNAYQLGWAVMLGFGMALVVSVQVHAMRRVAAARAARSGTASGLAFAASLLPSFLCCTPVIPSLLAFIGVSGASLYGATGTLQHFFAIHQTGFLAASLALLALTSWWGLRKVARATCLSGDTACSAQGRNAAARTAPENEGVLP